MAALVLCLGAERDWISCCEEPCGGPGPGRWSYPHRLTELAVLLQAESSRFVKAIYCLSSHYSYEALDLCSSFKKPFGIKWYIQFYNGLISFDVTL